MSPALIIDPSNDFVMPPPRAPQVVTKRTLLLSPPSLSSHQEKLTNVLEMHDRSATDMQMLDRLSLGLVSLPEATYDVVIILCDADGTRHESSRLVNRNILELLVRSMKAGAVLRSQDGQLGSTEGSERREAILAGLSDEPGRGLVKPDYGTQESVPLRLGRKKGTTAKAAGGMVSGNEVSNAVPLNGKRKSQDVSIGLPEGVGFDDGTGNNAEGDSDEELIDEDTLLDDEDFKIRMSTHFSQGQPLTPIAATECKPKAKRRRACKDCTCGLAAKLEAEDKAKRANADQALSALKLQADDLTEVDFTVKGKVGSCGNCSLGGLYHGIHDDMQKLTQRRCFQMRWLPVHWPSGV
jgi:anamorsin